MTAQLYKTTIVIWTDYDPIGLELDHLAREAVSGDAYCSHQHAEKINDPEADEFAPDMEFFENGAEVQDGD